MVDNQNNKNFTDVSMDQSSYAIVRQKLVVVGDVSVGKTAIINCLLGQKFKDSYEPSVGVDFFSKTIKFKGKNLKLQIWDSAGQEKYKGLIPSYIRGSAIIFVIYDVTNKKSFENIPNWIKFIKDIENSMIVLCGNKVDLNEMRKVDFAEGEKLAKDQNCLFFEVSAKEETNVQKMLYFSIAELPFFEPFKTERVSDLVGELEQENNETKMNMSSNIIDSMRNDLTPTNKPIKLKRKVVNDASKKQNCKC